VIERPAPQSDEAAATAVFKTLTTSERERPRAPASNQAAVAGKAAAAHPNPARIWIAAVAGALASFMVVLLAVWALIPRPELKPAVPAAGPKTAPVVSATPRPAADQPPPPPSRPEPPAPPPAGAPPQPAELVSAISPGPVRVVPPRNVDRPVAGPAAAKPRPREPMVKAGPPHDGSLLARTSPAARPADSTSTWSRFDLMRLDRPVRAKVTLAKILASPQSYSGQVVEPAGMYHLAPTLASHTGGARMYAVMELMVESGRGSGPPKPTISSTTELEVEPRLADRLAGLDLVRRQDHVAILTVWVTDSGACRLVKVENLEKATTRVGRGYKQTPRVEYQTLAVTPVEARRLKGDDLEWEKPERWLHFANLSKHRVIAAKKKMKDNEADQIGAQMNNMFGQMLKNVMDAEQQRLQLQRRLMGR
jgi:hypothetical protein